MWKKMKNEDLRENWKGERKTDKISLNGVKALNSSFWVIDYKNLTTLYKGEAMSLKGEEGGGEIIEIHNI